MYTYNETKFEKWLNNTLKEYNGNRQPYIAELLHQFENSGRPCYEISGRKTKSGHPECFTYKVKIHFFDENGNESVPEENDFAYVEIEFIL